MFKLHANIIDGSTKTPCYAVIQSSIDLTIHLGQLQSALSENRACSISSYNTDISWFDNHGKEILTELDKMTVDENGQVLWHASHRDRIVITEKTPIEDLRLTTRRAA